MKKFFFFVLLTIGIQSLSAQQTTETTNDSIPKFTFYVGFGAAFNGDYNINKNLEAADMPQIGGTIPVFTVGYNIGCNKWPVSLELNAGYSDKTNSDNRVKNTMAQFKLQIHYMPFHTKSAFLSAGADISYSGNQFDLYRRDNVIDMNNLNPGYYNGHISLNNEQLLVGPSVTFGFFQDKTFPLGLNLGYDIALTNGKWKSDFGKVTNAVKENGFSSFYFKLNLYLN